jgi:transposase-like protein
MPINVFDDQSIEISCARCGRTSPKTIAWRRAHDRFTCGACNSEIVLERAELPTELSRGNAELQDAVPVRLHKG